MARPPPRARGISGRSTRDPMRIVTTEVPLWQAWGYGVHATPTGYQARAAAIAQALEGCSSQRSSSGSHTIAP